MTPAESTPRAWLRRLIVALAWLALPCAPAWGGPPANWKDSGYAYNAPGAPLTQVLAAFALSHGVELRADSRLVASVPNGVRAPTASEFMDRLGTAHRFHWFVHNNVLHVSPVSDAVVERIEVSRDAIADAKAAVTGVGLFEARFGWGEMPEDGVITVSGPREYVRLVREIIAARDHSDDFEAMVFRLKHAAVDDRSITVRNQTLVTPGVATLLKNMVGGRSGSSGAPMIGEGGVISDLAGKPSSMPSAPPFGAAATGTSGGANVPKRSNTAPSSGRVGGGGQGASIEGDVRTNSIVVYDLAKRRSYYQRLVDSIDVPQQLVEIEAYIVEVNRERVAELGFGIAGGGRGGGVVVDPASVLAAPVTGGSTLILGNLDRFFARLSAMERQGEARVLARPSVVTLENLVAVLDLSQTVYIRATGERVATIEPVTAGMLLRVTPRVVKGRRSSQVHLTVDIEDGKVLRTVTSDTPEVQRSNISTQAVLEDRQSLVIGGYNTDGSSTEDNSVPGISKIPLIGALFGGTRTVHQSRQRLFILSPRVVQPTSMAEAAPKRAPAR